MTKQRAELKRRRRQELLQSLDHPHPDSLATAALGLTNWADDLPAGDTDLLDPAAGIPVRWTRSKGGRSNSRDPGARGRGPGGS